MAKLYGRKIKYAYIGQGEGKPVQKCLVLTEDEAEALKTEYAREIFAEIEELAKIYTFPVVKNGVVEIVKEPFWCIEPSDLAELKKKYTEAKDD